MGKTAGSGQWRGAACGRKNRTRGANQAQGEQQCYEAQGKKNPEKRGYLEVGQSLEQTRQLQRILFARVLRSGTGAMVVPGNLQQGEIEKVVGVADRREKSDRGENDREQPLPAQVMRAHPLAPAEPK